MLFLLKINIGFKCRHSLNFTIVTNGKNLEFLMKRTAIYSANLAIIHLLSPVFFLLSDEARSLNKNLRVQTFKGIRCSLSFPGNLYGWWENFTSFAFSWELAFRQSRMRHSVRLRVDFKWLSVLYAPFIVIHMSLKIIRYFPSKATKVQVLACKSVRIHFELNNFVNFSCLVYLIGKIGW